MIARTITALAAAFLTGCLSFFEAPDVSLAQARVSTDFSSYDIHRVGLVPFKGDMLDRVRRRELQDAFHSELGQSTPYELVLLEDQHLRELTPSEPYLKGSYLPRTIIELTRRFNLDAIFFGTITQERFYPPQVLSMQMDLVSAETGLVIWSGNLHLDADDPRVAEGLRKFYGGIEDESWHIALISPERFARFAAFQMACLL